MLTAVSLSQCQILADGSRERAQDQRYAWHHCLVTHIHCADMMADVYASIMDFLSGSSTTPAEMKWKPTSTILTCGMKLLSIESDRCTDVDFGQPKIQQKDKAAIDGRISKYRRLQAILETCGFVARHWLTCTLPDVKSQNDRSPRQRRHGDAGGL